MSELTGEHGPPSHSNDTVCSSGLLVVGVGPGMTHDPPATCLPSAAGLSSWRCNADHVHTVCVPVSITVQAPQLLASHHLGLACLHCCRLTYKQFIGV